ncbi:MAG: hypothetical protein SCM96_14895 [Acidobacteriota bacterium]|nr:hypothetical protein [Acidobacteriota bacterium]
MSFLYHHIIARKNRPGGGWTQGFRFETRAVNSETRLILKLAPGGGWAGIICPDAQAGPDR